MGTNMPSRQCLVAIFVLVELQIRGRDMCSNNYDAHLYVHPETKHQLKFTIE